MVLSCSSSQLLKVSASPNPVFSINLASKVVRMVSKLVRHVFADFCIAATISSATNATVSFTLTNTGSRAGAEVPQAYFAFPAVANAPPKVLRGFQKVFLNPGQSTTVSFTFSVYDAHCQYFDVVTMSWLLASGNMGVLVGRASNNILLQGTVIVH